MNKRGKTKSKWMKVKKSPSHMIRRSPILIVFFLTLVFVFSDGVSFLPETLQNNPVVEGLKINEAKAAVVNAVQSGTLTSSTSGTVTDPLTPAVDPARSFLIFQTRHDSNRPPGSMVRGRIDSTGSNVEFVRVTDGVAPEPVTITIQWYVVEFSSGVSVQRGEVAQTATVIDVTLPTPVTAVNQAFVTWSKTPAAGDVNNLNLDDPIVGELTTPTNLRFRVVSANASHIIWWQIIEFTDPADILVQKNSTSLTGGALSTTVTLGTPVVESETFVLVGYRTSGGGADIGSRMLRAQLTSPTTITIDRSIGADDITEIAWQAVWLRDGSSVQRGTQNFPTLSSTQTVSISSVDPNRSVAFASVQPIGGQNMGRSPFIGDDIPGVGSVTMALSSTQITMERDNTAAPADIGWFVVTFNGSPELSMVKQVWDTSSPANCLASRPADADCNGGTTSVTVPIGTTLNFLIYVDNPTGAAAPDVRIEDLLVEGAADFTFVDDSLTWNNNTTATGAALATLFADSGTTILTDVLGAPDDIASAVETALPAGKDRVTIGTVPTQANTPLNMPAGIIFGFRFQVTKN